MRINNNLMAMNTHRQLGINSTNGAKSIEKLSSGYRINRAGDDAAGLAISEKMRGQIRGLNQSSRNAQDSISLVQTAEGALNETQAILQRMRELAVQSANDTNVDADRAAIQNEVDQLATEITRVSNNTEFNERKLLDGGLNTGNIGELTFHIGANAGQNMDLGIAAMDAQSLGVAGSSTVGTVAGAGGDIVSAAVTGTAAAVTDGNVITSTTAEVAATAGSTLGATAYANIGAFNTALGDTTGTAKTFEISIDGGAAQTVTFNADYSALGAFANWAAVSTFVDAQITGGSVVGADATGLTFTSDSTGASSSADVTADADSIVGADTTTAGTDISYTVTLSDGVNTNSVVTGLAADAATVTGTGDFAGVVLTTDGALTDTDSNTITLAVTAGTASTFTAGALDTAAVATTGIDISTQSAADTAITSINTALTSVSTERGKLGAVQNRLEHTIKNLDTSSENLQASESRIRDVDMAKEMMEFTKNNILQQAAQSMLAQANQAPQGVLQLLR